MQTYLASAHAVTAPCPTSKSLSSHPHLCCKGCAIKALLPRKSCSSVPDCSFAFNLDGVSFFLFNLKMLCDNDMAYFWGDLPSCIHLWAKWIAFCFYLNTFTIYKSAWTIFCSVLLCPHYWWNSSLLEGAATRMVFLNLLSSLFIAIRKSCGITDP